MLITVAEIWFLTTFFLGNVGVVGQSDPSMRVSGSQSSHISRPGHIARPGHVVNQPMNVIRSEHVLGTY